MIFTRALPKNLLEISQIVANLWGRVSKKTLLSQIPFVEDVDEELAAVEKEEQEALLDEKMERYLYLTDLAEQIEAQKNAK